MASVYQLKVFLVAAKLPFYVMLCFLHLRFLHISSSLPFFFPYSRFFLLRLRLLPLLLAFFTFLPFIFFLLISSLPFVFPYFHSPLSSFPSFLSFICFLFYLYSLSFHAPPAYSQTYSLLSPSFFLTPSEDNAVRLKIFPLHFKFCEYFPSSFTLLSHLLEVRRQTWAYITSLLSNIFTKVEKSITLRFNAYTFHYLLKRL